MTPGILGTKIGMTRVIGERGTATPVTVVKAGPCVVLQVKTKDSDGYDAVQIGLAQRQEGEAQEGSSVEVL